MVSEKIRKKTRHNNIEPWIIEITLNDPRAQKISGMSFTLLSSSLAQRWPFAFSQRAKIQLN